MRAKGMTFSLDDSSELEAVLASQANELELQPFSLDDSSELEADNGDPLAAIPDDLQS